MWQGGCQIVSNVIYRRPLNETKHVKDSFFLQLYYERSYIKMRDVIHGNPPMKRNNIVLLAASKTRSILEQPCCITIQRQLFQLRKSFFFTSRSRNWFSPHNHYHHLTFIDRDIYRIIIHLVICNSFTYHYFSLLPLVL